MKQVKVMIAEIKAAGHTIAQTYSAITRSTTSWSPISGMGEVTWDCGHKHRTALAAYKCLRSMGNAGCAYHAEIEASDGSVVDTFALEVQCLKN